ncbi:MAG: 5-(carboxyamino)imidazole ribonucleotide mutase [Candidatus Moranbacteria bacterium]|nr:5-(carboxyamino)imidazole ribonucleotide mutase [Candidatus Moranbacteria bacterium]
MQVVILVGSSSDVPRMLPAKKLLDELGIECEMRITSAHRTPERTVMLVDEARDAGCQVFICGAGMAAHLAGAVAAQTTKPVIGVPLTSSASPLGGMDALLATVQMPSGMPVATVAIDGAKNAAWLAAQILALVDRNVALRLHKARESAARDVVEADKRFQVESGGKAD